MSLAKTLAGAIAGGVALGFGLKLGDTVLRAKNASPPQRISPQLEIVITAVSQLAEHSGRLEQRLATLEQRAGGSDLLCALEASLTEKLVALETVLGRHTESIASLQERTSSAEGCWQDLVSRMELICRGLAHQVAPPGVTVMRPRSSENRPIAKQTR